MAATLSIENNLDLIADREAASSFLDSVELSVRAFGHHFRGPTTDENLPAIPMESMRAHGLVNRIRKVARTPEMQVVPKMNYTVAHVEIPQSAKAFNQA